MAHGLLRQAETDEVIDGVPARVYEIEQRFAALRAADAQGSTASQPLGFGMMLEKERAASNVPPTAVTFSDSAAGATSDRLLTPAIQKSPGSYGSLAPPPELVQYGNGTVPSSALAPVADTGHRLWAPAANGLTAMIEDAAAEDITIGITDSYRPIEVQERLAREKGLYNQGGLAAVPGTSNHGWGVATDLDLDAPAIEWMRTNAWRYGFVEDVPREPWHWTYRPAG
jgi:LAS superfamily LD-carboxypeptidase LdcB